ncbi:MAG: hypothetical protein QOD33_848 [Pyrinomonadaceae bacterium]|jgi:hypothetical protein|nr:hypothetical protein [Pyrinomonadaceae bacterium]
MKNFILSLMLSLTCGLVAQAQRTETRASGEAHNQTSVNGAGKTINLDSGTRLTGELQNTIDARRAKVGDRVMLKTTQAIKSEGRTVVGKGSRLVGHVSEVSQATKGSGESRVGIVFDQLESGSLAVPIVASISSITTARASGRVANDGMPGGDLGGSAGSMGSARAASGNGNTGLLGGVGGVVNSTTSTVGGVVGGATSALGTTVNSTTGAVGGTSAGLGRSLRGVQISQSSDASVEGSSVLSLQGGNLRLEQGTNFNLVLTQSTSTRTTKSQ